MYVTDFIWWAFVAFSAAVVLFMLVFVRKVTQKGG